MDEQLSFDIAPPAMICRCCGQAVEGAKVLFDEGSNVIYTAAETAYFTRQEFKVAKLLVDRFPNTVTKESIYELAVVDDRRNADWPEIKIVDVIICKIRPRLAALGLIIQTVWGKGYQILEGEGQDAASIKDAGIRTRDRDNVHRWTPEREKQLVELMSRKNNMTACATIMRLPYATVERQFKRLRETHFAKKSTDC